MGGRAAFPCDIVVELWFFFMYMLRGKYAPAIFAVLYGSIMGLGQALHFLPGLGHFSSPIGHCCCCHHDCDSDPIPDKTARQNAYESSVDCPICNFLALCQDRPADPPPLINSEQVYWTVFSGHPSVYCEPMRLHSARGPPLA